MTKFILKKIQYIQCSPIITQCLVSIGIDHVISELCYKEKLQRNYRKNDHNI